MGNVSRTSYANYSEAMSNQANGKANLLLCTFRGGLKQALNVLVGGATGGGFETLRGDKTHCFILINSKITITQNTQYTPSLSL